MENKIKEQKNIDRININKLKFKNIVIGKIISKKYGDNKVNKLKKFSIFSFWNIPVYRCIL